jgi:hypothetical protein
MKLLYAASIALWPAFASAQTATTEEPPKVQEIRAVERGFFLQGDLGVDWLINEVDGRTYSPSFLAGVSAGYDLIPVLSISAGAYAFSASVNAPDEGDTAPAGDLLFLVPMAEVQLALVTTERNFFYVKGGAGFAFGLPAKIGDADYGGNGPAFGGSVGFERYTKLRHFSIGLHAGVLVVTKPAIGIGISLAPTIKYTF